MGGGYGAWKGEGTRGEAKQWNNRGNTAEEVFRRQFRLSAVATCDRKQTPTMFAGPAGVARVVCTNLGPLDSSWVIGLKHAQSCRTNVVSFEEPTTMSYTST